MNSNSIVSGTNGDNTSYNNNSSNEKPPEMRYQRADTCNLGSLFPFGFRFGRNLLLNCSTSSSHLSKFFDDVFLLVCFARQPNDRLLLMRREKWIFYFWLQHISRYFRHTVSKWWAISLMEQSQKKKRSIDTVNRQPFRKMWRFRLEMKEKKICIMESIRIFSEQKKFVTYVVDWIYKCITIHCVSQSQHNNMSFFL